MTRPDVLPVQKHRHSYTLDIKSSRTALAMSVMAGTIVLLIGFIFRGSVSNRQLAANDLKYRYVKMCGENEEKGVSELGTIFREDKHKAICDAVCNRVERHDEAVRRQAERLEQATIKERKAQRLLDNVKKLRGE